MEPETEDSLQSRMIRAARLDPSLYDEVVSDPRALLQAMLVVLLSAVATGISFGQGDIDLIVQGMVFALLGWWVTAYLAYFVGTKILPERRPAPTPEQPPDLGSGRAPEPPAGAAGGLAPEPAAGPRADGVLRAVGFANAPGLLRLLGAVPELAVGVLLVTTVWMVCATVVAIRQALGFQSTARAVAVYVAIQLLLLPLLLALLGSQVEAPAPAP